MNNPEIIAIIPARGGSKGIQRKNIISLAGKPLIAYSILAARHSNLIDRVIVSTEDEEIAEVAETWGAEVPFLRPRELAEDNSSVGDVVTYTMTRLCGDTRNHALVELYPTSPFRTPAFIDDMLGILLNGYSSVITVKEVLFDPQFLFVQEKGNKLMANLLDESGGIPEWKKYYRQYSVLNAKYPQKPEKHYYHVLNDKCMLIDIDTPQDVRWAEAVIENKLFDFGL